MANPIYNVSGFESTTESTDYNNEANALDILLLKLPDNVNNLIKASDVRDAIYTLWEKVENSQTVTFQNSDAMPVTVGGYSAGTTFVTPTDMQEMWYRLLYPYLAPVSSLSLVGQNTREYGDTSALAVNGLTLSWSVQKKTNSITTINVDGSGITPSGNNQSGTKLTTGNYPATPSQGTSQLFSMVTSDGVQSVSSNTRLYWKNKIYWGKVNIGSVDASQIPVAQIQSVVNNNLVLNLDGAGVGNGSMLKSSKDRNYNGINGAGEHLIFAWPSGYSGAYTPTFTVNGLQNTAYTRVRTNWTLVNQYGHSENYEVWVSNTLQNSPIASFVIS